MTHIIPTECKHTTYGPEKYTRASSTRLQEDSFYFHLQPLSPLRTLSLISLAKTVRKLTHMAHLKTIMQRTVSLYLPEWIFIASSNTVHMHIECH